MSGRPFARHFGRLATDLQAFLAVDAVGPLRDSNHCLRLEFMQVFRVGHLDSTDF